MTKQEVIQERERLNNEFWEALNSQNWNEVELLEKQMKAAEAKLRIFEDYEEVKTQPEMPYSDYMELLKRLKKN